MKLVKVLCYMLLYCFLALTHPRRPRGYQISLGESLLQELKSPWELILTEPVTEEDEFRPADWAEKHFSAQSAMRSSRVTLSPSYRKQFFQFFQLFGPCNGKIVVESFRKKYSNEAEEIASLDMGARNQYSSINFRGGFIDGISIVNFCGRFLHCCFWLRRKLVEYQSIVE